MKALPILMLICSVSFVAGLFSAACSTRSADEFNSDLRQAEMAVAHGDMKVASSVVESITDGRNLSDLSATQLARLSMVYMQMADESNPEVNTAMATDMYRRAFKASPDSAEAYFSSLPFDKMQYANMLHTLTNSIDSPQKEIRGYNAPDSASVDSLLAIPPKK